jgi:sterol desaturase/sphingolipid hydroxylase (fatty acid hydroxylase superfamily)
VLQTIVSAVVAMAAMIGLITLTEQVAPIERHSWRARLPGLFYSCLSLALALLFLDLLRTGWASLGIRPLVTVPVAGWVGDAAAVALGLVFYDFLNYWNHRFQHRFLWRIHSLHHSQNELFAANGYAHFSERALRALLFALPLSLVDFQFAATPVVVVATTSLLELYIHSPTSAHLGPLARVLVDNRFHRVHHSLEPRHFDRNFGILFSVWDRLFGTACELEPGEWPATGVAGVPPPRSVADCLLFPLRPGVPQRQGDASEVAAEPLGARPAGQQAR